MTDNPLTPADGDAAPQRAVAGSVEASVSETPAIPQRPTIGVVFEESTPGFGVVRLSGPQDASAGAAIAIGRAGVNNHSPSISGPTSAEGQVSPIGIAWIESPAGDISGVGAVMLQRLDMGAVGNTIDLAALAIAANDNATWVTDLSGAGAIGCEPAVAELASGDALIAWIGANGHVRGRLYPPMDANGASDGRRHTALNAALDDLGPVDAAPDGSRRLQVAELRSGAFAIVWTAIAQGDPVLRGSLFLSHSDHDDHRGGWTQHAIAEAPLPPGFAGPYSIAFAGEDADASLAVAVSGTAGTIALNVLDRPGAGIAGNGRAAESDDLAGPSAASGWANGASVHDGPGEEAAVGLDVLSDASQSSPLGNDNDRQPSQIVLAVAATLGIGETAPLVQTLRDGFAVAWRTPGETDSAGQFKLVLYDAHGHPMGPEILVADDAAAGAEAEMSALGDGVIAAYVDADDGALVVKTYAGDGAQIGQAHVVVPGDGGAIGEIALGSSGEDEFAVAYVQQSSAAGYGNIMLQRYCVTTLDGATCLVELGRDGERDGTDVAVQLTMEGGDPSAGNLAVGRAPAAIGVGDGGLAIAWVVSDGARETVTGVILDRHGTEVLQIDLSDLLGEAGIAKGAQPVLLDAGGGSFLVSWLQLDADGSCTVAAAMYRETAPGLWLAPEQAVRLETFDGEPKDYAVVVSADADGSFIDVIWSEDDDGPGGGDGGRDGGRDTVYSQRYDLEGRRLGDATEVAQGDAATGGPERETLAAAGLPNGQVVVHVQQGSGGDHDLFAHIVAATAVENEHGGNSGATEEGGSFTVTTRVDEETAINPLASALDSGLRISHINDVPLTTASPVDVGSGWVQLREDGWLTVTPDAGHTGQIAFGYSVAGTANRSHSQGHAVVNVEMNSAPAAVTLLNQVTAVAEAVSTASALKVADIAMADAELGPDGLSLTGLDASMFEIVGNALYLKEGIDLDFETKPTLSVEILASHANGPDGGANFALSVASPGGAPAFDAAIDAFLFAPGYGETIGNHPLVDLSSTRYTTFRELVDSGALTEDGGNVVITLNPDDPADPQQVILTGVSLSALSDTDFKFS